MCDIAVCIAKVQDNAEMDCLVYEIKLGTSTVSLSIVYCKFEFLCVYSVFTSMCMCFLSLYVGDCKLILVHLIIYSLARKVCIHFY